MKKSIAVLIIFIVSLTACFSLRNPTINTYEAFVREIQSIETIRRFFESGEIARLFGIAFGPDGIIHISESSPSFQEQLMIDVPELQGNFTNWPQGLRWVPRKTLVWFGDVDHQSWHGNTYENATIPACGEWWASRGFFTVTLENCWNVRFGFIQKYWDITTINPNGETVYSRVPYVTLTFAIQRIADMN